MPRRRIDWFRQMRLMGASRIEETAPVFAGFANGKNCRLLMNSNPEKVSEYYVEKANQFG